MSTHSFDFPPNGHSRAVEPYVRPIEGVVIDLGDYAMAAPGDTNAFEAESFSSPLLSRPCHVLGVWSAERPQFANNVEVEDLAPGVRLVSYNDKLTDKKKYAKHEVVLSDPYLATSELGEQYLAVDARRVTDHATDTIPLDSDEGKRSVALSFWGITPTAQGYNTTKYVELYEQGSASTQ